MHFEKESFFSWFNPKKQGNYTLLEIVGVLEGKRVSKKDEVVKPLEKVKLV